MLQLPGLRPIGQVAVFYIPVQKLDLPLSSLDNKTPRQVFEEFLMMNYDAYTLEISNTQGFWREHKEARISHDANVRYEVSFDGKDRVPTFVDFLSRMCAALQEEAIYLTLGFHSYLVLPKVDKHEVRTQIPQNDTNTTI